MEKYTPREKRCWVLFHNWSRWVMEDHTNSFQRKACLRCGRQRRRFMS